MAGLGDSDGYVDRPGVPQPGIALRSVSFGIRKVALKI